MVIGSITPNDCNDVVNSNSSNIQLAQMAMPTVSGTSTNGNNGNRSGIVFLTVSTYNGMPVRSWTRLGNYPSRECISVMVKYLVVDIFHCSS